MTPLNRIRQNRLLRRWHRRLGLAAAIFLLWMAISGILLNHSDHLDLPHRPLAYGWLRELYDMPLPALHSFSAENQWLTQADARALFLDDNAIGDCRGTLVGFEVRAEMSIAICSEEMLLLGRDGAVLERINAAHGLPVPLLAAASADNTLLLRTPNGTLLADLDQLQFSPATTTPLWRTELPVNAKIRDRIAAQTIGRDLNAERVLRDLHAGKLLGGLGVWLLDITALMVIVLTVTGCWLWWRHVRHTRY